VCVSCLCFALFGVAEWSEVRRVGHPSSTTCCKSSLQSWKVWRMCCLQVKFTRSVSATHPIFQILKFSIVVKIGEGALQGASIRYFLVTSEPSRTSDLVYEHATDDVCNCTRVQEGIPQGGPYCTCSRTVSEPIIASNHYLASSSLSAIEISFVCL
jgi:hypothetical protein